MKVCEVGPCMMGFFYPGAAMAALRISQGKLRADCAIGSTVIPLSRIGHASCPTARPERAPEPPDVAAAEDPLRLDRGRRDLPDAAVGRRRALHAGHPDGAV